MSDSDNSSIEIKIAAERWVNSFNAFPASMIEQLIYDHSEHWDEIRRDSVFQAEFPVCAYYYQFSGEPDKEWLKNKENMSAMIDCGFRLFKHNIWGMFFCIDGFGYDLFEKHWIPLYKKRTLEWHENDVSASQIRSPNFR